MSATEVRASDFKAKCLALLDEVAEHRHEIVVTKRGRPVARLVPIDEAAPLVGSVTFLTDADDDLFTTGDTWDVDG